MKSSLSIQSTSSMQPDSLILVGVTGSIAAYKSCDLVRSLVKQGYSVQVLMTKNAERFVSKLTFQALSNRQVFSSEWEEGMVHINMKNIAGFYVICPASANCIGKFANGIADDIISSTYLAINCPVILGPAMNPGMYTSAAVQRNLQRLEEDGVHIIKPSHGKVVCGDTGQGKMAPIEEIETTLLNIAKKRNIILQKKNK